MLGLIHNSSFKKMLWGQSQTTLTKFWLLLTTDNPIYVDIFYLINVDKKLTFLDYFSCQRSLWMPLYRNWILTNCLMAGGYAIFLKDIQNWDLKVQLIFRHFFSEQKITISFKNSTFSRNTLKLTWHPVIFFQTTTIRPNRFC